MSTGKDYRQGLVEAYVKKAEAKAEYTRQRREEATRPIRPLSPFSHHPEKLSKLGSTGGNVIIGSPIRPNMPGQGQALSPGQEWWRKQPTIAGEGQTEAQQRLSSPTSFTGMYKKRFEAGGADQWDDSAAPVGGDLVPNPRRAMTLLKDTSPRNLTIPQRACDFRTEVEWRLMLRNTEEQARRHHHHHQQHQQQQQQQQYYQQQPEYH